MTHDLFIRIERMTPDEYENDGKKLCIRYHFTDTRFGRALIASTGKGICYLAFGEDEVSVLSELRAIFPKATYMERTDESQQNALRAFEEKDWGMLSPIILHIKGTSFQFSIWENLIKIPLGELTTYSELADRINNPKASRAVGSAVGANPVSFLIPCHRVVRRSGALGGYHWGLSRKVAMINWENSQKKLSFK